MRRWAGLRASLTQSVNVCQEIRKNTEILKIILVIFLVGSGPFPFASRGARLNLYLYAKTKTWAGAVEIIKNNSNFLTVIICEQRVLC